MGELPISLLPASFPALSLGLFPALLTREDLILVSEPRQGLSLLPAPPLC